MEHVRHSQLQAGFSLIELLVAATVFTFTVTAVAGLFAQTLDLQRRGAGLQRIQENAQFVVESVAREVRVSQITSGNTDCDPPDVASRTLTIEHPVNGTVTYAYDTASGEGLILRNGQSITTSDVDFLQFAFCVSGAGVDGAQARVTMPMMIEATSARSSARVQVSLQTTIVSRDLTEELSP